MSETRPTPEELRAQKAEHRRLKQLRHAFHGNPKKLIQPVAAKW